MTGEHATASNECGCASCAAIEGARVDLIAHLSAAATALSPELGDGHARSVVLAALTLATGDAILSWVAEDMRLVDIEKHAGILREACGGVPFGVTVQ